MGKTIRRLIGVLLLVTAVAVTQIPAEDVEAVDAASASDFQMNGTTLVKYVGTSENVSVSGSVKKIEASAFADNNTVKSVSIEDGVEVIGASAFAGCGSLESVTVPDSVESIGNGAFARCPVLRSVSVGSGLTELGNGAFAGDYSLASVQFDEDNSRYVCDGGAVYNANGRDTLYQVLAGRAGSSYAMPDSVKKIKPYAFWGDYHLESVSVGSQVAEISAYAFSNCKNLHSVEIPYSVNRIDMKAFEDCVRLREIVIPPSVSSIHSTAFDGCTRLHIAAEPGSAADTFAQTLQLDDIDVSEYEETPETYDDDGSVSDNDAGISPAAPVDYYHEVSHMNAMEQEDNSDVVGKTRVIGSQAFVLIDNAQAPVNVGSTGEVLGAVEDEAPQNTDTVPGLAGSDDAKGGSFPKYTIVNGSVIAAQAYYDDDMTSYEIPDGIEKIGEFAFARSGLTSIRIPDGVTEIGYASFYHCDSLTDVTIPGSVSDIGTAAFAKTPWLQNWKQNVGGDEYLIVGDGILLAYKGTGSVVSVPATVKQIGPEAFMGAAIEQVILPDSVEVIGEAAFADCAGLTTVTGGANVREIRDRAFAGCPLATVHIPASVRQIGLRAYDSTGVQKTENTVAVFDGAAVPALVYGASAGKLYRDEYRDMALKGCNIAVLPDGVQTVEGTVLGDSKAGFQGVICVKGRTADGEEDGTLRIVGRQGSGAFPEAGDTCRIDGVSYTLQDGESSLDGVGASGASGADAAYQGIDVKVSSYTLPQEQGAFAVMEGSEGNYTLTIQDDEAAAEQIGSVYKQLYGSMLPHNLCAYDMKLTDEDTGVEITSLGRLSMEVTLPMPKGVTGENLHVVCLDADGQLEEVDSRVDTGGDEPAVVFTAKHFSYYGIYNYSTSGTVTADVENGQAVFASLGNKDVSPDTGDSGIHPKWFLCIGLACTALALFFYRGGKRSRRV